MKRGTNSWELPPSGRGPAAAASLPRSPERRPGVRLRCAAVALALLALTLLAGSAQAQSYQISTVAGGGTSGAYLSLPTGVATDNAGSLYVADASNCVIWKISGGVTTVFAGSQGNCSTLEYPLDVSYCGGNVYFATHGYDPIPYEQSFTAAIPGAVYMVSSSGTLTTLPMPPGPPQAGALFPVAMATDSNCNVYLSSYYYIISSGGGISILEGFGGTVDEIPAGATSTVNLFEQFDTAITGIAVDSSSNVYALMGPGSIGFASGNPPAFNHAGFLYKIANGGATAIDAQDTPGGIPNPGRLALDNSGNFLITEATSNTGPLVDVLSLPGPSSAGVIAGNGMPGYSGDGGAATLAELYYPEGMTVDSLGDVFIADSGNQRIRELRPVQSGPGSLQLSEFLSLTSNLGFQQYALNPTTGDFFFASSGGVSVLGNRFDSYQAIEALIPAGPAGAGSASPITLIVDPIRNLVYANNSANGTLYVIDGTALKVVGSVAINNPNARLLAIDSGLNQVYVGGPNSSSVSVVQGGASPVLRTNISGSAGHVSSLGVDPNSHFVYGVCDTCAASAQEGLVAINGSALTATNSVLETGETNAVADFIGNSLAVDPNTGWPIVAGAVSPIPNCSSCTYPALDIDYSTTYNYTLSTRSASFPFAPITVALDPTDHVFYVSDSDGVPTDPSSNVASVDLLGQSLSGLTVPVTFPNGGAPAHIYDVKPDTTTFQAYVSAASQAAGSPAAPQGIVELWDGLSEAVTESVVIPNAGGGPLAVNSATHIVYLMDNVNQKLYTINSTPLTPVAPPVIEPAPGPIPANTAFVTITGNAGDVLYYTTDGSAPLLNPPATQMCGDPCAVPIPASGNTLSVNAVSEVNGTVSSVATAVYTLQQSTTTTVAMPGMVAGGFPVMATATITSAGGSATGTVTFTSTPQGSSSATTLCSAVSVASNQASCTFTPTLKGMYAITATYSGDAYDTPSFGGAMLAVTSSGNPLVAVGIPYAGAFAGLTPVAVTTNNTGSSSTYVLNSDGSVASVQNGGPLAAVCPSLPDLPISDTAVPDTVKAGAIYYDATSSPGRIYMAFAAYDAHGYGLGIWVASETVNSPGSCTQATPVQVTSISSAEIELTVDPQQGNVYVLATTGGSGDDLLNVYSTSTLSLLSQNDLDVSSQYGPLVLDGSTHRLYVNDTPVFLNTFPGMTGTHGFFVFDPNQSGQQLQHVAGYFGSEGEVLFNASALLEDGKGDLIIVNENPIPSGATNPLPTLSTPITILNTNQFSFFANTFPSSGYCCGAAVDIQPGAAMTTISAVTPYTAMSAADLDPVNGILYGYTYNASVSSYGVLTPTTGSGALFAYSLATGSETPLGSGLSFATTIFGHIPWTQMTFDPPSEALAVYASQSGGAAVGVSAPVCPGTAVPIAQVLGGSGTTGTGPGAPGVNFTTGYVYDIYSNFPLTPATVLYDVAQQPNQCPPITPLAISPASGTTLAMPTLLTQYAPMSVFTASGGVGTILWSVTSGTLPNGISVNPMTGALSGTPTQAGSFTFTVVATDSLGTKASGTYTLQVICTNPPSLDVPPLVAYIGVPFSYQISPVGGTPPYKYFVSGYLAGLNLNPTGLLSGTPSLPANFLFSISVTDTYGCSATEVDSLMITRPPPPVPVPGVVGESQAAATMAIINAGFNVTITTMFSPTVLAGIVISQSPAPPAEEIPGTYVNLVVSLGPQMITLGTILESVHTTDSLGNNSTLISAYVLPTITETVTTTDTVGVANTATGSSVMVTPPDTATGNTPVTLTFPSVTQAGNTTLTISSSGPASPGGYQLGSQTVYYNLSTTAVYSGMITVCINYAGISFPNGTPSLWHYSGGAWANITTSVNAAAMTVCGMTSSLSPFALFQPAAPPFVKILPASSNPVTITTDGSGNYIVNFTVINQGNVTADVVSLSAAKLGAAAFSSAPVSTITSLAAGASGTFTLTFPASAGAASAKVAFSASGTYSAGTLSGNWSFGSRAIFTLP